MYEDGLTVKESKEWLSYYGYNIIFVENYNSIFKLIQLLTEPMGFFLLFTIMI